MKKFIGVMTVVSCLLTTGMVFAAGDDFTSPINGTTIDASIADYGTITIPKELDVSGGSAELQYSINAVGSIAGDHVLNVTMPATITFEQNGKNDVECSITDNNAIKYFVDKDYDGSINTIDASAPKLNGTDTLNYTINMPALSAGDWHGILNISVNIEDKII